MAQPAKQAVASNSLLALIVAFLDWCHKHRAHETYERHRYRLEQFARRHPDLQIGDLKPFHIQQWIDAMDVANGTKRIDEKKRANEIFEQCCMKIGGLTNSE